MFTNIRYAGKIPDPHKLGHYEEASYPKMVTLEEYDRVQVLLAKHGKPRYAGSRNFNYKGILFCGECRCSITAEAKRVILKNGTVKSLVYYHCTHKRPCAQRKNVEEQKLEREFHSVLENYQILPQFEEWALDAMKSMNQGAAEERQQIERMQHTALVDARRRYDRLVDLATSDAIKEDVFKQKSEKLLSEIEDLEERVELANNQAQTWRQALSEVIDTIAHCRERFDGGDIEAKKGIIQSLGSNYVLLEGKIKITPHPWLIPITDGYKALEAELEGVRSNNQQMSEKELTGKLDVIQNKWLAIVDQVRSELTLYPNSLLTILSVCNQLIHIYGTSNLCA